VEGTREGVEGGGERERAISINSPDRNVEKFNVLYNTKLMEDEAV
jgi:hypothetical protein